MCARGANRVGEDAHAPWADVAGHDDSFVVHPGRDGGGLATRRGAGIEYALPGTRVHECGDELRRLVLQDRQSGGDDRLGVAGFHHVRAGCPTRGLKGDLGIGQCRQCRVGWAGERVQTQRGLGHGGIEAEARFGGVCPETREPACDEPVRMGVGDPEPGDQFGRGRIGAWPGRDRQLIALAGERAQDAVDEPGGGGLSHGARERDGVVNDGGGRDAGQVQELIRRELKQREHLGIEA